MIVSSALAAMLAVLSVVSAALTPSSVVGGGPEIVQSYRVVGGGPELKLPTGRPG